MNKIQARVSQAAKAVLACGISVIGSLATAAADGHLTLAEGLIATSVGLAALAGVYGIPNAAKSTEGA